MSVGLKPADAQTSFDSIGEKRRNVAIGNDCACFARQIFAHALPELLEQVRARQAPGKLCAAARISTTATGTESTESNGMLRPDRRAVSL